MTPSVLVEPNGGQSSDQNKLDDAKQPINMQPIDTAAEEPPVPPVLQKLQKWADYPSFGQCVAPTRFIPGKTPLAQEILDNWTLDSPPKYPHTVRTFIEATAARGDHIGAFIDLANHTCLYSQDLPDNVEYEQVQLVAKQLPSQQAIDRVAAVANAYWARHPDRAIAIHCAYGATLRTHDGGQCPC